MATAQHRIILVNEYQTKGLNKGTVAVNKTTSSLNKLDNAQKKSTKNRKDFLTQFTKVRWALVNATLIAAIGVALGKLVFASQDMRLEFQKLALVSNESLGSVQESFNDLRDETLATNKELISSFQELAKAGFNLAEQTDILKASAGASLIGFSSLEETAMATSQAMRQFGFGAGDASEIAFKLAAAANKGKVDIDNIGEALKFSGAIANQAGTSFEELISTIAILSNKGLQMSQVGRGLRQALLSLLSPSAEAERIMNAYNIQIQNVDGSMKSITEIMNEFEKELSGLTEAEKKNVIGRIFPSNAISIVLELMGETNAEVIDLSNNIEDLGSGARIDAIVLQQEAALTLAAAWQTALKAVLDYTDSVVKNVATTRFEGDESFVTQLIEDVKVLGEQTGQAEKINKRLEAIQKQSFALPSAPSEESLGYSNQDVELLIKFKEELESIIDPWNEFLGTTKKFDGPINENNNALDSQISILNDLGSIYDVAKSKLEEYNREVVMLKKEFGDTEKAEAAISIATERFITVLKSAEGIEVEKVFKDLLSAQEDFNEETADGIDLLDDYKNKISLLQSEIRIIGLDLSNLRNKISDVNDNISNVLSRRFKVGGISETDISHLIRQQQIELEKAKFSTLGLGTAEEFLRNASVLTTDTIDDQTAAIQRLSAAASDGQDMFDSWQTTLQETIRALLINSQDLDRDVTGVVKKAQTELLGITRFDRAGGNQFTAMEQNISALQMAEGIFFGQEKEDLKFSEDLREDRINGMNESAEQAIQNLTEERSELEILINTEQQWIDLQDEKKRKIEELRTEMLLLNAETREQNDLLTRWNEQNSQEQTGTIATTETKPTPIFDINKIFPIFEQLKNNDNAINQSIMIQVSGAKSPQETAIEIKRELATIAGK